MRLPQQNPQKSILLSLLLSLYMGLTACQPTSQNATESTENSAEISGKDTTVRISIGTTTGELFLTEIVNIGLEQLGYKTEIIPPLTPPIIHTAVSNGDSDFYAAHGEKIHQQFYEKSGGDEKLERVGAIMENALQGYQIDKKTADQYNISSIDQLKNPEIAQLFDSDGDGKANLTGCDAGWGCSLIIEHHLDTYGLQDTVEHDQGQYDTLLIDTITRYKQGQPILYYAGVPHWSVSILKVNRDVIWLEVPFTSLPKVQGNITEEETSFQGKNLGFAIDRARVIANKKFLEANPSAKRLFEQITIPIEDINAQQQLIYNGEDRPEDIRRHAEEWVQNNQDQFDNWVKVAKQIVQ